MSARIHHNAKPMDSYTGLQPMSRDDLAFAQRNAVVQNVRADWRAIAAVLVFIALPVALLCLSHGVLK
jgi:hypothetical protein